jgi:hypothetical protein
VRLLALRAAPGTFFAFFGCVVIGVTVWRGSEVHSRDVSFPVSLLHSQAASTRAGHSTETSRSLSLPELPAVTSSPYPRVREMRTADDKDSGPKIDFRILGLRELHADYLSGNPLNRLRPILNKINEPPMIAARQD